MGMIDQEKRERVVDGLKCYLAMRRGERIVCKAESCPYWEEDDDTGMSLCNNYRIEADALSLLNEQMPRLMTYDELSAISRTDSTVYVERRTKTYYNEMAFVSVEKVYGDTVSFNGQKSIFGHSKKDYGKEWRCWTSRPSDEQMKAVKWE